MFEEVLGVSYARLARLVTSMNDTELNTSKRCRFPLDDDLQYAPIHCTPDNQTDHHRILTRNPSSHIDTQTMPAALISNPV